MSARKRRTVVSLKYAKLIDERPPFIPLPEKKGIQGVGLRYEKKIADVLKRRYGSEMVLHGAWFEFEDRHGPGWCSPDILVIPEDKGPLIICECKLTVTREAERQLRKLYAPVVGHLWPDNPLRLVQIAHNLKLNWFGELATWDDVMDRTKKWEYATINWRLK